MIPLPQKIGLIALVLLGIFTAGYCQGLRHAHDVTEVKSSRGVVAVLKKEHVMASNVAAIDEKHQKESANAAAKNEALHRSVRSGAMRLYVRASCPASLSAAASVPDAAAPAELDPAAADDLISITNDGDEAIRQLTDLQEYVTTILKK